MMARRLFLLLFAVALLTAFGCGGGGGGGGDPVTPGPTLGCTDASASAPANGVTMACGAATSSSTELVKVLLVGPASGATTLRGLSFDVLYEPLKLEYVPAENDDTSLLFSPNALVTVKLFNGQPGRLVVSIQEFGAIAAPVSVGTGRHEVLSLSFRRAAGATFDVAPLTFENAEGTTASAPISFAGGLALSYH